MCFGPKVADKQDQRQVAYLEAAGYHSDISALQVEPPLQGGQHAHLKTTPTTEQRLRPGLLHFTETGLYPMSSLSPKRAERQKTLKRKARDQDETSLDMTWSSGVSRLGNTHPNSAGLCRSSAPKHRLLVDAQEHVNSLKVFAKAQVNHGRVAAQAASSLLFLPHMALSGSAQMFD
ncbi:hypothetical protein INR49_007809 [Caranx melampygus]|nr:hypothetical protein INR49_007809 [Caranx melampygus]